MEVGTEWEAEWEAESEPDADARRKQRDRQSSSCASAAQQMRKERYPMYNAAQRAAYAAKRKAEAEAEFGWSRKLAREMRQVREGLLPSTVLVSAEAEPVPQTPIREPSPRATHLAAGGTRAWSQWSHRTVLALAVLSPAGDEPGQRELVLAN
jgi:hypothetical protein